MLKSITRLSLVAAMLLPMAVMAEENYVKIGVGKSTYDYNADVPNDHPTGYLLAYGVPLGSTLGIEAGLVGFGKVDLNDGSGDKLRVDALYAAGIGALPISQQASLYGKLGLAVKRFASGGDSATRTSALVGAGARWNFTPQWGASLEYTYYGKNGDLTLSQTTIAAIYNF